MDDDLKRYYGHFNLLQVLGSAKFKEDAIETFEETDLDQFPVGHLLTLRLYNSKAPIT